MVLTSWLRVIAWVHRFTQWTQNSARWLLTFGPSRRTWAIGPPVGSYIGNFIPRAVIHRSSNRAQSELTTSINANTLTNSTTTLCRVVVSG